LITLFKQDIDSSDTNVIRYTTRNGIAGLLIMNSRTHEVGTELKLISKYSFWYYNKETNSFTNIPMNE